MTQVLVVSRQAEAYQQALATAPLPGASLHFASSTQEALPHADSAEVLFGAPDLLAPLLPHCSRLRWLQSSWAGVTPLIDAGRDDYCLTGVRGIFGQAMSEYVLGWLLALERHIPEHHASRSWWPEAGGTLAGKRLGILGTGSIGCAVAAAAAALGVTVTGLNSDGRPVEGFTHTYSMAHKQRFAQDLDYLLGLLPDTPATRGVVDAPLLSSLHPGAILINAGRGSAVQLPALLDSLAQGQVRHAVLDVLEQEPLAQDDPLWTVPGLTITSHTAAPTPADAILEVLRDNYLRYREGQPLRFMVDFERGY